MFDSEYVKEFYTFKREHIKFSKVSNQTSSIEIFNELVKKLEAETPKYNKDYSEFRISCIYTWGNNQDVLEEYRNDTILPKTRDEELSSINDSLAHFKKMLEPNQYRDYYEAVDYYELNILKFIPKDNSPDYYTDIYLEMLLYRED